MACAISKVDICRKRGDTAEFTITLQDENGVGIDVTGFSFLLTVDPSPAPPDAVNNLFQLSIGSGITVTDAANGVLTIGLSGADADQAPGTYFYDLQWTDGGGLIRTVLEGEWQVEQDVTK